MTSRSSHLLILPIFLTEISPELMQIFANGKWRFYSFMEFYAIHSNNQGVKVWSHSTTLSGKRGSKQWVLTSFRNGGVKYIKILNWCQGPGQWDERNNSSSSYFSVMHLADCSYLTLLAGSFHVPIWSLFLASSSKF